MNKSLGTKIVRGTIWSACDRFGVMALQFLVNLILARLLTPADFGAIGLLMIFIIVSKTFIDGGFSSALIQKKIPTDIDYSTIFYWNITLGIILYTILYLLAPQVAVFYNMPILCGVLRLFGLSLLFSGIVGLQLAKLQKDLKFKYIAITNIISYLVGAIIAIVMALEEYGVWSLVTMYVSQPIIRCIMIFVLTRWLPKLVFSFYSLKELLSFGGYLFLGNILESICKNLQGVIIGKKFSAAQMGYFTQADKLDQIISYSVPQVIASVMYPVFSQFQEQKAKLIEIIKLDLRILSFILYPLLFILIIIAEPLIHFLYGNQWSNCIPYFQILCCGGFFYSINNIPYYAVASVGRSKSLFIASIYKWTILGLLLIIGMNHGMEGIMWSIVGSYINILGTNTFLAHKYIGIPYKAFISSLLAAFSLSLVSGIIISIICNYININWFITLIVFIGIYLSLALIFKIKTIKDIINLYFHLLNKI